MITRGTDDDGKARSPDAEKQYHYRQRKRAGVRDFQIRLQEDQVRFAMIQIGVLLRRRANDKDAVESALQHFIEAIVRKYAPADVTRNATALREAEFGARLRAEAATKKETANVAKIGRTDAGA